MTKKRRRNKDPVSIPGTRANSCSSGSEFVVIDNKNFTKKEIQSYVSELKADAENQSIKIDDLSEMVIELNKKVQHLLQKQISADNTALSSETSNSAISNETHSEKTITVNNSSNAAASTCANDETNSDALATICDIDETNEDDMETSSIISSLMEVPNPSSQYSNGASLATLLDQQRALMSYNNNEDTVYSTTANQIRRQTKAVRKSTISTESSESPISAGSFTNKATILNNGRGSSTNNSINPNGNNKILISKPQNGSNVADNIKLKFNKKICPEIIVFNMENKKHTVNHIKSLLGHDRVLFKFINKDKTSILTENVNDRKKVLGFLKDNLSRFITFTPSDEKPLMLVIKYIDKSFNDDDIKNDIMKIDKDIKIINLKILESAKPLAEKNIWLLQVDNNEKSKSLLGKKNICFSIVSIESFKSNSILQCKRCQHFNHSAKNCHQPYRCVKCGKQQGQQNEAGEIVGHEPGKCPLNELKENGQNKSSELFCCNCSKFGHTANYKKCEKYVEQVEKKNLQLQNNKKKKAMFDNFVSNGLSFADQLRGNKQEPAKNNNNNKQKPPIVPHNQNDGNAFSNSSFLESECNNFFGSNMFEMLNKINNFIPLYKKSDAKQKPLKLLEFLIHISDRNGST